MNKNCEFRIDKSLLDSLSIPGQKTETSEWRQAVVKEWTEFMMKTEPESTGFF
jgi:hypothetical protein